MELPGPQDFSEQDSRRIAEVPMLLEKAIVEGKGERIAIMPVRTKDGGVMAVIVLTQGKPVPGESAAVIPIAAVFTDYIHDLVQDENLVAETTISSEEARNIVENPTSESASEALMRLMREEWEEGGEQAN